MTDIKQAQAALELLDTDKRILLRHLDGCTYHRKGRPCNCGFHDINKKQAIEVMRQALKAYIEREQGWRDIKTAPRDGTRIIVMFDQGSVTMGFWGHHEETGQGEGWIVIDEVSDYCHRLEINPDPESSSQLVFWMPLPAPSEVSTEATTTEQEEV